MMDRRKEQIWEKSLKLLSFRAHSQVQLQTKLAQRGYSEQEVAAVIPELTARGYLDDQDFARQWLRGRLRKHPEGYAFLLAGLLKTGVSRDVAKGVLDAELTLEILADSLVRAAEKLKRRSGMTEDKLRGALYRRGFSLSAIDAYLGGLKG